MAHKYIFVAIFFYTLRDNTTCTYLHSNQKKNAIKAHIFTYYAYIAKKNEKKKLNLYLLASKMSKK